MTVGTSVVTHSTTVRALPGDVYRLVADVTRWPVVFGPTVHVEHLHHAESAERFTIWALVNGSVAHWTSERAFDPGALRIDFRQEHSTPPVASMGGTWEFLDQPGPGTQVVLTHEFSTVDGSADGDQKLREALDRNSESELGALRLIAEAGYPADQLIFKFEDAVRIAGPVAAAYDFINRADEWHRRLPHVREISLAEPSPGIQHMTMETVTADGAAHTTSSVRVCTPNRWIAYKQTAAPAPLLGHSGIWSFRDFGESGCLVVARHMVLLDPAKVTAADPVSLTPVSDIADIADRVRSALSGNSKVTLSYARKFAEKS
jgi:aromatase